MKKINKPIAKQSEICERFRGFKYTQRILEKSLDYDTNYLQVKKFIDDEEFFIEIDKTYRDYMISVYENRFSHKGSPSYKYYKEIRDRYRVCPYCNFPTRSVKELDHYLPKAHFPAFAVTTNNLVPICKDCNDIKDDYYSVIESNMLIHPYYEQNIEFVFDFLKCKVIENENIGFEFSIQKIPNWNDAFLERVKFHYYKLKIDDLYRTDFEAEFAVKFEELKYLYMETGDVIEIKNTLQRRIDALYNTFSRPWEYAGLKSLLESKWFFDIYIPLKFLR